MNTGEPDLVVAVDARDVDGRPVVRFRLGTEVVELPAAQARIVAAGLEAAADRAEHLVAEHRRALEAWVSEHEPARGDETGR